jgi:arylsulfatase A-like enzyme
VIERFLEEWLDFDLLKPAVDQLWWLLEANRKEAAAVNRQFLDWLARRRQPERPFFAFLNYFDAHYPYELPETGIHRFGSKPRNNREASVIRDWMVLLQKGASPHQISLARTAYDDCVADLDEQIGRLIDELERRSLLERTWVIVTSDHGESFGEQPGVFWHGTSLYRAQLHVPLVILPPRGGPLPRIVSEPVSLRDLAATIVDVLGWRADSPFPGPSLARFWQGSAPLASAKAAAPAQALSEVVPLDSFGPDPSQWLHKPRWPLAALTEGDWTYIRREGNVREELFHLREDAREQHNRAGDPALEPVLERMRAALGRLTVGPLTPQRFNP